VKQARRRAQAGFTLIEIMVALIVSSLLVAMILSIFTSMSAAYRTQQQVAELQQVLQAADVTVEDDLRQAGFRCAQGFTWAGGGYTLVPALLITDGGTGAQQPDQISVFYGDPTAQAQVLASSALPGTATTEALTTLNVDAVDPTWQVGDLVLFTVQGTMGPPTAETSGTYPEEAYNGTSTATTIPNYYACVLQIAAINGNTFVFSTSPPWGSPTNSHCNTPVGMATPSVISFANTNASVPRMLYRFVARGYRIDPTRKDLSVFQQSPSGALIANDWVDLGLGFTNFQIASRWYEPGGADNTDPDSDPWRNWYSSGQQNALSLQSASFTGTASTQRAALQVSVSFVVRTTRRIVDGTVTAATPPLENPANIDANDVGDSPSVTLAGVADASRPQELRGDNIYRYSTIKVDTRNLGNGR
jgi:prepilin-type N-terminal cleavage/methylation domain-containing protein